MKNFLKYQKNLVKKHIIKTVALYKGHIDFIEKNNLNLSLILRDALDRLIKDSEKSGENDK